MSKRSQNLVSIVIPTYNHAHLLSRALMSVKKQTWKNWEVIVVDNHSTDHTDNILKSWLGDTVRIFKIHNNGVIAASRNLGIRQARGDWVAFLDSDDWWKEQKLESSMRLAMAGADVVYHDLAIVGVSERVNFWRKASSRALAEPAYHDLICNGNGLPNSSVLVRKEKLDDIGLLREDPNLVGWEDYDCWLRLAKSNCKFARVTGCNGYYWVGGGNVSNPKRTLENISAFINEYTLSENAIPWWCYYSMAIAHNKLGATQLASQNYFAALRSATKLKSKLVILLRWIAQALTQKIKII